MHDELRRHAMRGVWWRFAVVVLIGVVAAVLLAVTALFEAGWPPSVAGGWTTVAVAAAVGLLVTVGFAAVGESRAARRAWPRTEVAPAPDLAALAEGVAIARGEPVPRVWRLDAGAPNVACLPIPKGRHVVVSTAAQHGLRPDELEAVLALQFSLLLDPGAALVRRALVASALLMRWTVVAGVVGTIVAIVHDPLWSGLTVNVVVTAAAVVIAVLVLVRRRLRWSWGIVGDAVALETTRHPDALVRALRRLAGHNQKPTSTRVVRSGLGAADPFWAVSVRVPVTVETMVVNGRARRRSSSAMVDDAALLLRARLVEMVCLGGEPATFGSWQQARDTFRRLSVAAGDGPDAGAADPSVAGVTVTVDGATAGSLPPVGGTWRSAGAGAPPSASPFARPRLPDAAALRRYDAVLAGEVAALPPPSRPA